MVTTFLTFEDYRQSALTLDDLRLKKQCVEAMQLLDVLQDLHFVAETLGLPKCPLINLENLLLQDEWVKLVSAEYKQFGYYFYISEGVILKTRKEIPFLIIDSTYVENKHYFFDGENVQIELKPKDYQKWADPQYNLKSRVTIRLPRDDVIIKERKDRIIKLGYANHPAARMWLTYENSLISYLNAHLDEYFSREGKHMNIPRYEIDLNKSTEQPWWLRNDLIISNRASLLRKQNSFYKQLFEVEPKYHNLGYIWPAKLSKELAFKLINDIFDPDMFAPVAEVYRDVEI